MELAGVYTVLKKPIKTGVSLIWYVVGSIRSGKLWVMVIVQTLNLCGLCMAYFCMCVFIYVICVFVLYQFEVGARLYSVLYSYSLYTGLKLYWRTDRMIYTLTIIWLWHVYSVHFSLFLNRYSLLLISCPNRNPSYSLPSYSPLTPILSPILLPPLLLDPQRRFIQ